MRARAEEPLRDRLLSRRAGHRLRAGLPVADRRPGLRVGSAPLDERDHEHAACRRADRPDSIPGDHERIGAVPVCCVAYGLRVGKPERVGTEIAVGISKSRGDDPRRDFPPAATPSRRPRDEDETESSRTPPGSTIRLFRRPKRHMASSVRPHRGRYKHALCSTGSSCCSAAGASVSSRARRAASRFAPCSVASSSCSRSHSSSRIASRGPTCTLHSYSAFGVVRAALPDGAADLALDALDGRALGVVLLLERVPHLLDGESGALPLDAVDRATRGEEGGEDDEEASAAKHAESLPE